MKLLFILVQQRLEYRIAEIEALLQLEGCPVKIGDYDPKVRQEGKFFFIFLMLCRSTRM